MPAAPACDNVLCETLRVRRSLIHQVQIAVYKCQRDAIVNHEPGLGKRLALPFTVKAASSRKSGIDGPTRPYSKICASSGLVHSSHQKTHPSKDK